MLYTPLMPEAASGTVEPRHAVVPVRVMCPHADLVLGRATAVDRCGRTVAVETIAGERTELEYDSLVVALGGISRTVAVPGLDSTPWASSPWPRRSTCVTACCSNCELASATRDPTRAAGTCRSCSWAAGYAGVEAMAELEDLVADAVQRYPESAPPARGDGCWSRPPTGSWPNSRRASRATPPSSSNCAGSRSI